MTVHRCRVCKSAAPVDRIRFTERQPEILQQWGIFDFQPVGEFTSNTVRLFSPCGLFPSLARKQNFL
jgi:hypothetical protein